MKTSQTNVLSGATGRFVPPPQQFTAVRTKAPFQPRVPSSMDLSPARQALIEMLGHLNYGRLENLGFRAGEPLLDPPMRVVRTLRFGAGEETGCPSVEEIASRPAVQELLQQMGLLRDGKFLRVEVRACSPVFSEIELSSSLSGGGLA